MNNAKPHLDVRSDYPPLKKNTLRLYSMRYCPWAQRTRMVLVHKKIPVEVVQINLKKKPAWFLERFPVGAVPCLEYNNKLLNDSAVCDDYLDDVFKKKKLYPKDPYLKARLRILMEGAGKVIGAMTKVRQASPDDQAEALANLHKALQPYEDALKGKKFFGGADLCMLDIHLWPWLERSVTLPVPDPAKDVFPPARLPRLRAYVDNMRAHPTVKATMYDAETHRAYTASLANGKPNYDGL